MRRCVLLKCGELVLKGRNRWRFEAQLRRNLQATFRPVPHVRVQRREGVYVLTGGAPLDQLVDLARDVMGIAVVHPAARVAKDVDAAGRAALTLLEPTGGDPHRSFAIRARRRDKRFPVTSQQIAVRLGDLVRITTGMRVDLSAPDVEIGVEVDENEIFVYTGKLPGQGGLPVGVNGRALVLLSGGLDSPVAGYRAMRRGLRCDFVHFTGLPFTSARSVYKAYALVRQLSRFQPDAELLVVPLGAAQRSIATAGAGRLAVLTQRRLMAMTAARLAVQRGAQALVTGDSLGQVASQTLSNLTVVDMVSELPLLRPLLGFDKAEIVAEAGRIGTLATSQLPDEDCCALLAGNLAETRADPVSLARVERRLDVEAMVDRLVADAWTVSPTAGPAVLTDHLRMGPPVPVEQSSR
jgi:thiamine biosynthesis protein ThiI